MSFRTRPQSEKDLFREILARLDDLERVPISPVVRRGDEIWFVDPTTGEEFILNPVTREGSQVYYTDPDGTKILLAPECPCGGETPGNYTSFEDIHGFGHARFIFEDGKPDGPSNVGDFDQAVPAYDDLFVWPYSSEALPFPGPWPFPGTLFTGGTPILYFASTSNLVDFINTDVDASLMGAIPSGINWDGTPAPALVNPVVHYKNLGTEGGVTLLTADNLGPNDMAGMHAHVVGPIGATDPQNLSVVGGVFSRIDSIVETNAASGVITATPGVEYPLPAMTAPGPDWLIVWAIHVVGYNATVDTPVGNQNVTLHAESGADYELAFFFPGFFGAGKAGGCGFVRLRTASAGTVQPSFSIDGTRSREVALSGFRCLYRDDLPPPGT